MVAACFLDPRRHRRCRLITCRSQAIVAHHTVACLFDTMHRLGDFVCPSLSKVTVAMQYYSMLLAGSGTRLCLLYAPCESLAAWLEKPAHRPFAKKLSQVLFCAISWTYRRHVVVFQRFPWLLASLPDDRAPLAFRQDVAKQLANALDCDVDSWFTGPRSIACVCVCIGELACACASLCCLVCVFVCATDICRPRS